MSEERTAFTREQAIEFAERWFDRKWGNLGQYQSLMETMVARLMALKPAEAALRAETPTRTPLPRCQSCGRQFLPEYLNAENDCESCGGPVFEWKPDWESANPLEERLRRILAGYGHFAAADDWDCMVDLQSARQARAETPAPRKWCNKCGFQPCNCFKVTDLDGEFDE